MDQKYITFKRDEWEEFAAAPRGVTRSEVKDFGLQNSLRDSVVIRLKDEFASAALHTYANSISVAARAIGMHAPATSKRLQEVADYFHSQAVESDEMAEHKLPD